MMTDLDAVHDILAARLAMLKDRVGRIEGDLGQPLDDDSEEQVVERAGIEALDAVEGAALADIAATEAALRRIELGSYGICTSCGDPIAPARLAALPAAAQCIACARGVDRS